jgi:hypothetical protein
VEGILLDARELAGSPMQKGMIPRARAQVAENNFSRARAPRGVAMRGRAGGRERGKSRVMLRVKVTGLPFRGAQERDDSREQEKGLSDSKSETY